MYHMCDPQSRLFSYLCPAYTEFSQFYMTCVQHDRVNCSMSESFFHMNEMIGKPRTRFHDHRQHGKMAPPAAQIPHTYVINKCNYVTLSKIDIYKIKSIEKNGNRRKKDGISRNLENCYVGS